MPQTCASSPNCCSRVGPFGSVATCTSCCDPWAGPWGLHGSRAADRWSVQLLQLRRAGCPCGSSCERPWDRWRLLLLHTSVRRLSVWKTQLVRRGPWAGVVGSPCCRGPNTQTWQQVLPPLGSSSPLPCRGTLLWSTSCRVSVRPLHQDWWRADMVPRLWKCPGCQGPMHLVPACSRTMAFELERGRWRRWRRRWGGGSRAAQCQFSNTDRGVVGSCHRD